MSSLSRAHAAPSRLFSRFSTLRKGVTQAALAVSLVSLASTPTLAKTLATVNGTEITDEDLAVAREDFGASLPQQMDAATQNRLLLDSLIDVTLAAQKAQSEKMDTAPGFERKLNYYREKLLMEAYLGKAGKDAATPENVKKTYETVSKAQPPETEFHAKHILTQTEDEAKAVQKRLKAGEDFAKVADEVSKDPGSKGGDLGWFTKDRMTPEFGDAVAKMEKGQISDPVKTQFGWHIIKLDDKRQKSLPPFETIKDQVQRYTEQKAEQDTILKLREGAKITRFDEVKPASAPKDGTKSDTLKTETPQPNATKEVEKPAVEEKK